MHNILDYCYTTGDAVKVLKHNHQIKLSQQTVRNWVSQMEKDKDYVLTDKGRIRVRRETIEKIVRRAKNYFMTSN